LNNYDETITLNQNIVACPTQVTEHCNLAEQQLIRQSHSWRGVNALEVQYGQKRKSLG